MVSMQVKQKVDFVISLSAKNILPDRKSFMHHSCEQLSPERACRNIACTKRHTNLILVPAYDVRCTHVHRSAYACTAYGVHAYTVRNTPRYVREATTKYAGREAIKHLENPV